MLDEAWAALRGDPAAVGDLDVVWRDELLPSPLPVAELASATVAAALLAAGELAEARGRPRPAVALDPAHVAAAFLSERYARAGDAPPPSLFHPLSAFLPAADGWVRTHANYPHHRAALLAALGITREEDVRAALAERAAVEVEDAVAAAGGCAAAVRDEAAWRAHPQGAAIARATAGSLRPPGADDGTPTASATLLDFAPATRATERPLPPLPAGALPAAGTRVLDLTRVIAGPVGTRMLGALGAEVLRIDPPHLPEIPHAAMEGGPGKRSAFLDLRAPRGRATLEDLLHDADVLVHGYRPGALAAFGIDPPALAERHPHLAVVTLSAWGTAGPWAQRRGFDSLVQAASGIATACGDPGKLPAQALDHGTGYLIAAAALRAITERTRHGRAVHAELALARTAHWLLAQSRRDAPEPAELDPAPYLQALGDITLVAPPGSLDGDPLRWLTPPPEAGGDAPRWRRGHR
jgi:crotonobetainyl-CoA:carnitine CoA-transferase CaiB-like acyl-CoA transferase